MKKYQKITGNNKSILTLNRTRHKPIHACSAQTYLVSKSFFRNYENCWFETNQQFSFKYLFYLMIHSKVILKSNIGPRTSDRTYSFWWHLTYQILADKHPKKLMLSPVKVIICNIIITPYYSFFWGEKPEIKYKNFIFSIFFLFHIFLLIFSLHRGESFWLLKAVQLDSVVKRCNIFNTVSLVSM